MDEKNMKYVDISLIDENNINEDIYSMNDIEHLASIIKENGFNSPITVYKKENGRYEIISGHRRYKAMCLLKEDRIPIFEVSEVNELEKKKQLISSNMAARRLSPLEMAKQIAFYEDILKESKFKGEKRKEIARFFNLTESNVQRYRCLLKLIPELQELTKNPNFPYSALRAVANLCENQQREVFRELKILETNLLKNNRVDERDTVTIDVNDNVYTRTVVEQIVGNVKKRENRNNPKISNQNTSSSGKVNWGKDDRYQNEVECIIEDNDEAPIIDVFDEDMEVISIDSNSDAGNSTELIRRIYQAIYLAKDDVERLPDTRIVELYNELIQELKIFV